MGQNTTMTHFIPPLYSRELRQSTHEMLLIHFFSIWGLGNTAF